MQILFCGNFDYLKGLCHEMNNFFEGLNYDAAPGKISRISKNFQRSKQEPKVLFKTLKVQKI